jgi:hypothetical protein
MIIYFIEDIIRNSNWRLLLFFSSSFVRILRGGLRLRRGGSVAGRLRLALAFAALAAFTFAVFATFF